MLNLKGKALIFANIVTFGVLLYFFKDYSENYCIKITIPIAITFFINFYLFQGKIEYNYNRISIKHLIIQIFIGLIVISIFYYFKQEGCIARGIGFLAMGFYEYYIRKWRIT